MGGTNIDGVVIDKGKIIKSVKNIIDKDDLFTTIWNMIKELISDIDKEEIGRINLSTTVSTNAIVEEKISKVGMIIQSGPGINNNHLKCGDEFSFISGYTEHRGNIVDDFDIEEVNNARKRFKEKDIKNIGIVTKFSTRNPTSENTIKALLKDEFNQISLGHNISGKLNFPRRVYTTYLNSAVYDTFNHFYINISKALKNEDIRAPIFILKADGGTFKFEEALEKPVETILSGPAASFMGIDALTKSNKDSILIDIGGTTTDIFFLVDGVPLFEPLGIEISGYKTLIRAINSSSIGLGGDSKVYLDNNQIKISSKREGPAYALGGESPTFTDAMIVLDYLQIGDGKKAEYVISNLGKKINKNAKETSQIILDKVIDKIYINVKQILDKINSRPIYTIKELLSDKKVIPESINIIGGPAKILAPMIEKKFNLPCNYPKNYSIANAIGSALAKATTKITLNIDTNLKKMNIPELNIYEDISGDYTLNEAKNYALELLAKEGLNMGLNESDIESEIIEESSFNMVEGFFTKGKIIRVVAQIKPGLIESFRGDISES